MVKHRRTAHRSAYQRGQWTIVGSLVALAIIIVLAAVYLPRLLKPRPDAAEHTAIQAGQGAACSEYAAQMNQAVAIYRSTHDDQPPTSIDQLKSAGVTDDIIHAPGCSFVITNGVVTETGRGMTPPRGTPPLSPGASLPSPPPNTTVGPGGIRVPTGGSSPEASGGE